VFIQDERVEAATFFKLSEASFLGLIGMRRGAWIPNASYHAFQLYTQHFGATLVGARTEAPTYDSVKAGIVPAMKRVPLLESVASVSADGSRLYVMLINKSADQSADVSLAVGGFEPASGTAHLLTGPSPDSNTGTELPNIPGLRWARQVNVDNSARHFDRGAPSEVTYASTPLPAAGRALAYRLPPHSVASIELRRK
jgi:alpha-L-arabinofuranosidase